MATPVVFVYPPDNNAGATAVAVALLAAAASLGQPASVVGINTGGRDPDKVFTAPQDVVSAASLPAGVTTSAVTAVADPSVGPYSTTARTGVFTLAAADGGSVDLAAGAVPTLPAASANKGREYYLTNVSTGPITITASGSDVIGNSSTVGATYVLAAAGTVHLRSNGSSAWRVQ